MSTFRPDPVTIGRPGVSHDLLNPRDPHQVPFTFVTSTADAVEIVHTLRPDTVIAMDTETVYNSIIKLSPFTAPLRVVQFAVGQHGGGEHAYVFDVRDMDKLAVGAAFAAVGREHWPLRNRVEVLGYNANFDDPVTTLGLTDRVGLDYAPLLAWVDLMYGVGAQRLGRTGNQWYPSLAKSVKRKLGLEMDGKGSVQLSYTAQDDLTVDQIRYAANDAILTLWLGDVLSVELEAEKLVEVLGLECGGRPFLQAMTYHRLGFDESGWRGELGKAQGRAETMLHQMAHATDGGQHTLFEEEPQPTFNPGSPKDVRKVLNTYCTELVRAYLANSDGIQYTPGKGRVLEALDKADKVALGLMISLGETAEMDVTLPKLLIAYGSLSKLESTYGPKMMALLKDGGFPSEYTQCLTDTGRTSSRGPNAQNYSPWMKPYFKSLHRIERGTERVVPRLKCYADYATAELRVSAQLTGEQVRSGAFERNEDQHAAVAAQMFNLDMAGLLASGKPEDAKTYKQSRQRAKVINFGLGYGMGAARLANTLTLAGSPTTKDEAAVLIEKFFAALPHEAAWLNSRDAIAKDYAAALPECDFDASLALYKMHSRATAASKRLATVYGYNPSALDIAEDLLPSVMVEAEMAEALGRDVAPEELAAEMSARADRVAWALSFDAPVVLLANGNPVELESRTLADRRRLFHVPADAWILNMAMVPARSRKPQPTAIRKEWAAAGYPALSDDKGRPLNNKQLSKVFEDKQLRLTWIDFVLERMPAAREFMQRAAVSDYVRSLANQFRNSPVQGTVGDIAMFAFAELTKLCQEFAHAYPTPVLTVHDSIVIEVDAEYAQEFIGRMQTVMEACFAYYVPAVVAKADVKILCTLDEESGKVEVTDIPAYIEQYVAHYAANHERAAQVAADLLILRQIEADEEAAVAASR